MSDMKLLPSQSELISQIVETVVARPSFVVLNGEEGSGKTFLSHFLAANGMRPDKHYRTVIFGSRPDSEVSDVRAVIIKGMFSTDVFDRNEDLSETARLFEIAQKNFLVIVDAVDYFDQNFLNELYRFYLNYGAMLNLSIVITTSHLLVDLINSPDSKSRPDVFEVTIRHLSPGEKITLLKTLISRKVVSEQLRDISFEELAVDCGSQPNQIVAFAEKFVSDTIRKNDRNLSPNGDAAGLKQDGEIRKMTNSISGPKGPNKIVVIVVAVILTIALLGVIALLLKRQPAPEEQEEVLVTTHTDFARNGIGYQSTSGEKRLEQEVVDGMIKGRDSAGQGGKADDETDIFAGNIPDGALKPEGSDGAQIEPKSPESQKPEVEIEANGPAAADGGETAVKADPNRNVASDETNPTAVKEEKPAVAASQQPEQKTDEKKNDGRKADDKKSGDKTADGQKPKDTGNGAVANPKEDAKPLNAGKKDKTDAEKTDDSKKTGRDKPKDQKTDSQKKPAPLKAGEVVPFETAQTASPSSNLKTSAQGNFVVQVACNSNIGALQSRKKQLGSKAFIYERKNNALKYVLVVGYYATRAEAAAEARRLGGGAWVKTADAVRKEKVE